MKIQQNLKSFFFEKTNLSKETFLKMTSNSQEYSKKIIFDIIFYIFLFLTNSYSKCKSFWNNSIDYIDFAFPYISNTFQLKYLKTTRHNNDYFQFTAIKSDSNINDDANEDNNDYQLTYSNNRDDIFKNRLNYDFIMVNHANKYNHVNVKHIRIFNKEQIKNIQSSDDLYDYKQVDTNPFIYLSINKNTYMDYDPENKKTELNVDNPVIQETLSMFYVKNNIIDRNFLEFMFRHYFQVNLNKHPNYVIDCITNDVVQKQYVKKDTFEFKIE